MASDSSSTGKLIPSQTDINHFDLSWEKNSHGNMIYQTLSDPAKGEKSGTLHSIISRGTQSLYSDRHGCITLTLTWATITLLVVLSVTAVMIYCLPLESQDIEESAQSFALRAGKPIATVVVETPAPPRNKRHHREQLKIQPKTPPPSTCHVSSPKDLDHLDTCSRVIINQLSEPFVKNLTEDSMAYLEEHVTSIEFVGPTKYKWVENLLTNMPQLEQLTLDVSEFCRWQDIKSHSELPKLHLPQIKRLKIRNARVYHEYFTKWILLWDMPGLKELHIKDANIFPLAVERLEGFVHRAGSLETIIIEDCYRCSECELASEVQAMIKKETWLEYSYDDDGDM